MDPSILENFSPKVIFTLESEGFTIKTATTLDDLKLALQLRHQVFLEEGLSRRHETGMDFDTFDQKADHLMIINNETGLAVGTYRLIHSDFSPMFYSQGEFFLDNFLNDEGTKLELGRACTHIDHRTGRTMDLLWQGLSRYIRETNTRFLFGCSSIKTTDPEEAFSVTRSLEAKDSLSFEYEIHPIGEFVYPDAEKHFSEAKENPGILRSLPPLLRSYLHAGSKVHGYPAIDRDFKCTDMLTILDLTQLNKKFNERYNPLGTKPQA